MADRENNTGVIIVILGIIAYLIYTKKIKLPGSDTGTDNQTGGNELVYTAPTITDVTVNKMAGLPCTI